MINSPYFIQVTITRVNSVDGDASVTMIRGKKKFIYDYIINLDWKLQLSGIVIATGSVTVGDVTSEGDYTVNNTTPHHTSFSNLDKCSLLIIF